MTYGMAVESMHESMPVSLVNATLEAAPQSTVEAMVEGIAVESMAETTLKSMAAESMEEGRDNVGSGEIECGCSKDILISGSGIAGSVFAFWLLRAYPNANITIVERDPSLRLTGASVDIRSSAVDIIKWMGAEQEIRNQTTNEEGIQFVEANGKAVATLRATGRSDIQSITSEFEIFRGVLAKIFIDPIINRVKLIFDESVDHFEQRDDRVVVTFAKSKEVKTYDLLVAADGLGSKIRGMMLNSKPQEQLYDEGVHVAYFTIKSDLLQGGRLAKWYNATGGRVVFLRPDPDPAGRTRGNFMNVTTRGDIETKERLNTAIREGNESYMKLMEEMFSDARLGGTRSAARHARKRRLLLLSLRADQITQNTRWPRGPAWRCWLRNTRLWHQSRNHWRLRPCWRAVELSWRCQNGLDARKIMMSANSCMQMQTNYNRRCLGIGISGADFGAVCYTQE